VSGSNDSSIKRSPSPSVPNRSPSPSPSPSSTLNPNHPSPTRPTTPSSPLTPSHSLPPVHPRSSLLLSPPNPYIAHAPNPYDPSSSHHQPSHHPFVYSAPIPPGHPPQTHYTMTPPVTHEQISVTGESEQKLLCVLRDMGFLDERKNEIALRHANGNVLEAVQYLLGEEIPHTATKV
jgi:hypothetical protein